MRFFFLRAFQLTGVGYELKKSFKVCLEACPITANCPITTVQNDK